MKLDMSQTLRLTILCDCCDGNAGNSDEHEDDCPRKRIIYFLNTNPQWSCPKCRGTVEQNDGDFLECRKCKRVYSTSGIGDGPDMEELTIWRTNVTREGEDEYSVARLFAAPGKGKFVIDKILAHWNKVVATTKKAKATERALRKQAKDAGGT